VSVFYRGARAKAIIAYNEKIGKFRSGQVDLEKNEHWPVNILGIATVSHHKGSN